MELWTYSPEEVIILIGGVYQVIGLKESTFVNIERDDQPIKTTRHADGSISRLHTKNTTYTVTLTVINGSPSNEVLDKIQAIDEITQMGKFPLYIKDGYGVSLFFSASSWIEKTPTQEYANVESDRVWTFKCASTSVTMGGNNRISSDVEDVINGLIGGMPEIIDTILG